MKFTQNLSGKLGGGKKVGDEMLIKFDTNKSYFFLPI